MNQDSDITRATNCAGLTDAYPDPGNLELLQNKIGYSFGHRFDKLEFRFGHKFLHLFGNRFVIQRIADAIRFRCTSNVGAHFEIDADGLMDPALLVLDANDRLDFEFVKKNSVSCLLRIHIQSHSPRGGASESRDQRASA